MTKKEFTALLIAFLGAWLMLQGLLNLYSVLNSVLGYFAASFRDREGTLALISLGISTFTVLFYGGLATFIIRKSGLLAEALLYFAKIGADEKIEGISFPCFLPIGISLLGLYFIVTYLPSLVITSVRWFALEANTSRSIPGENTVQLIQKKEEALLYDGAVLAAACFVFLRADLLAKLADKYRKTSSRIPESTPTAIESPAPQEPRQP